MHVNSILRVLTNKVATLAAVFVFPFLVSGCAFIGLISENHIDPNDARPCAKNFSTDGSMMSISGKSFMTSAALTKVSKKVAMDRMARQISLEGQTIKTLDRESGLIAISQQEATSNQGRDTPITAIVEGRGNGVFIQMKATTGFGMSTTEGFVRDYFCRVIGAVGK